MSKEDFSNEDLDALDKIPLGEMLEGSEEVSVTPPPGGVKVTMALRIEKDVLRDLEVYARSIGEKPSTLARMLIKEGLMSRGADISLEAIPEILSLKIAQSQSVLNEPSASWGAPKPLKPGEKAKRELLPPTPPRQNAAIPKDCRAVSRKKN